MTKPPRRNHEAVKRVAAYRKKNLTFREIARIMKSDVKSVYRWYAYGTVGSYPQK